MATHDANLESVIKTAKDSGAKIDEARIWKWTTQLLCALGKLHTTDICHRAIKPANIFLDAEDNVRLGVVGIARPLTDAEMAQTPIDDLYYTSPEVARNMAYESKSDMWAIGCVIRELMILEKPFLGTNALDLLDTIKLVRPAAIPSADYGWDLRELSKWFLQKDVAYRPSALDMYSFLVREWKTETEKYTALIKPEDVPWASDVLMAKKGKLEWNTGVHLGMTAEEREAMPDKEDREEYAKLIDDKNTAKKDIPGSVSA